MEQIQNIATRLIQRSPLNPRKTFDEDGIKELAENIERQGLLQPITVRPIEYRDDVVDGEVKAKAAAKLRKKQDKIEKELTKLGYDTEGKKLAF